MFTSIGERISVLALFQSGQLKPLRFHWKNQSFSVSAITTSYQVKNGNFTLTIYAVQSSGNIYKLIYNPQDLTWTLDEIYTPN